MSKSPKTSYLFGPQQKSTVMSHLKTLFFCLLSLGIHQLFAQSAGGVVLSPDGAFAAYTVSTTDWKDNSHVNEIWIAQKGQKLSLGGTLHRL